MAGNSFGQLFRVTSFGESHGPALGCIIDGCPPGLAINRDEIHNELSRRRPGSSHYTSQRKELDEVEILSGVFEGVTTGTPIGLLIKNNDAKPKDYAAIKNKFRPGHGDFSYQQKYAIRDYRGGGRASARETAMRVAAGAIAKKFLRDNYDINIRGFVKQVGPIIAQNEDYSEASSNEFQFPDKKYLDDIKSLISELRQQGDSIGGLIKVIAEPVPAGLGEPVFDKLDAEIASAMMGINAVKGVSIGSGFDCVTARGSEFNDPITISGFTTNHAGGILAGISSGQPIEVSVAIKPPASIRIPMQTITDAHQETMVSTLGRHDTCIVFRAVVIAEAMLALVLIDHCLRHRGQNGNF